MQLHFGSRFVCFFSFSFFLFSICESLDSFWTVVTKIIQRRSGTKLKVVG